MITFESNASIHYVRKEELGITAIVQILGLSRHTVRKYLDLGMHNPKHKTTKPKPLILDPFRKNLLRRLSGEAQITVRQLHIEIKQQGYMGSYSSLAPYVRKLRSLLSKGESFYH